MCVCVCIVRVYDGNAPTATFPVFSAKHTLFVDDSDDDDDKGKGVAPPSPTPGKHTRFPDSDDDE